MAEISMYKADETDFTHNGIVSKDAIYCEVEEELNGKYVLELKHPISDNNIHLHLKEESIIKADGQLFRIYSSLGNLGYIEVKARHIFYDLLHNFLMDVRPTDLNGTNALNWILDNTQYPHKFRGVSDIGTINTQYYIRKNPVEAMLGSDSLTTRWGGELVRDNFTIKLLRARGSNKGAQIAYGKNLMGLEVEKDMDSVATRIMPVGNNGLLLPEKYIDSPLIDNYNQPYIKKVEIDVGGVEEEEEAFDIMRQKVSDLYEFDKVDMPYINIKADLALLENTEEYKDLKHLVKVELGDVISCTDNPLGITFEAKVIRVKKDILSNKNVEVELGQFKKGLSDNIKDVLDKVKEEIEINKSDLEKAIENATDLITSALGGYVIKREGEILIMDEEDPNTATKVWRFNLNGLGYSSNGVNGPYRLAMTMDGSIVADFITTGVLNASLLKTGLIKPQVGDDFINMENGHFKLGGMSLDESGFELMIEGTKAEEKIANAVNDMYTSISVDVEGISAEISNVESRTETKITDGIESAKTYTTTQANIINARVDGVSTEMTNLVQTVDGDRVQTNERIGLLEASTEGILGQVSTIDTKIDTNVETINRKIGTLELTDSKFETRISSNETKTANNATEVASAHSRISQTENEIDLRVKKGDIASSINLTSQSTKIASKNVNLVGAVTVLSDLSSESSLGNIYAGRMQGPGMDINLNTGRLAMTGGLTVNSPNGQVIIDGSSNMFKIAIDRTVIVDGSTNNNHTQTFSHGLGYVPAFVAYQVNIDDISGSNLKGSVQLPALGVGGGGGGWDGSPLAMSSIVRMSVDSQNVYINYIRAKRTDGNRRVTVRYYLYKEALL